MLDTRPNKLIVLDLITLTFGEIIRMMMPDTIQFAFPAPYVIQNYTGDWFYTGKMCDERSRAGIAQSEKKKTGWMAQV
jgi:hypothetical protein